MRKPIGSLLRTIAATISDLAELVDPQPPKPEPGSCTVINSTGTTTYEPRLTWHKTC